MIRWKVLSSKTPPKTIDLEDILGAFYAGSTIPIGLLLLWCSIDRRFIVYLNDLHLTLAAAGIATLWVAYKGLRA